MDWEDLQGAVRQAARRSTEALSAHEASAAPSASPQEEEWAGPTSQPDHERTAHVEDRIEFGHWEGDLIIGNRSTVLAEAAGVVVYVCDPHIPWQRGSKENTNGLLRHWFPRSTDAYLLDRQIIADVQR